MSYQVEVAESICSALYRMDFADFLGERDEPYNCPMPEESRCAYFHLGESPKDMRVTVIRPSKKEAVYVKMEWRNYFADGRNPLKGEQTLTVTTYATSQDECFKAAEQVVLKILETYREVLSEEGVAGKIADLVQPEETNDNAAFGR